MYLDSYKISLPVFEGPLDLLLHLIRKNDIDIADIPIATLLTQYLDALALMQELNIDMAGEFILMAAELTHIKSKMLLPDQGEGEDEGEDLRIDLARRLLEYQQYKEAAGQLWGRTLLGRDVFIRGYRIEEEDSEEAFLNVDSFKLLTAFNDLLKKLRPEQVHQVMVERLSVTERIYELLDLLKEQGSLTFESLFEGVATRAQAVVSFLAILEMMRLKLIYAYQTGICAPIRIRLLEKVGERSPLPLQNSEFDQKEDENHENTSP